MGDSEMSTEKLLVLTRFLGNNELVNYFLVITLYNNHWDLKDGWGYFCVYILYMFSKITKVPWRFGFIFYFIIYHLINVSLIIKKLFRLIKFGLINYLWWEVNNFTNYFVKQVQIMTIRGGSLLYRTILSGDEKRNRRCLHVQSPAFSSLMLKRKIFIPVSGCPQ